MSRFIIDEKMVDHSELGHIAMYQALAPNGFGDWHPSYYGAARDLITLFKTFVGDVSQEETEIIRGAVWCVKCNVPQI